MNTMECAQVRSVNPTLLPSPGMDRENGADHLPDGIFRPVMPLFLSHVVRSDDFFPPLFTMKKRK